MASSDDHSDAAIFSDERVRTTSPPSSPPPMLKKDAFSILGKRKVLSPIPANTVVTKKPKPTSSSTTTTPPLTQLQISLGQTIQKKCPDCGMSYITSSSEDRTLHKKYHSQILSGYDVGKNFLPSLAKHPSHPNTLFPVRNKPSDTIIRLMTAATPHHSQRNRIKQILQIVQRDLGAVEIPEKELDDVGKYTAYLYLRHTKCIGFLLLEDITRAYTVLEPAQAGGKGHGDGKKGASALAALKARQKVVEDEELKPVVLSGSVSEAVMGVSRIWTLPAERGQGIAGRLLDVMLETVRRVMATRVEDMRKRERENLWISAEKKAILDVVDQVTGATEEHLKATRKVAEGADVKSMIAFSQPTAAGTKLARKWFGKRYGWLVYVD